jgi:hypothetical protein
VTVKEVHTFWFMTGTVWAVVIGGLAVLITLVMFSTPDSSSLADTPGGQAFAKVDELIRSEQDKGPFHGNNQTARYLAASFAETASEVRAETIQGYQRSSKEEFLTYCHLDDKVAVFLVQVPGLRKFDDEAKERMGSICWWAAHEVLDRHFSEVDDAGDPPVRLVVGLRGTLRYDRALQGRFVPGSEEVEAGLESTITGALSKDQLIVPFAGIHRRSIAVESE